MNMRTTLESQPLPSTTTKLVRSAPRAGNGGGGASSGSSLQNLTLRALFTIFEKNLF